VLSCNALNGESKPTLVLVVAVGREWLQHAQEKRSDMIPEELEHFRATDHLRYQRQQSLLSSEQLHQIQTCQRIAVQKKPLLQTSTHPE